MTTKSASREVEEVEVEDKGMGGETEEEEEEEGAKNGDIFLNCSWHTFK